MTTLAPLGLILILAIIVYQGLTGKNFIKGAVEGFTSGQFFGLKSVFESFTGGENCNDVSVDKKYQCIQDKINYCTTFSIANAAPTAQNEKCFTSKGVPLTFNNKVPCLLPPTVNPLAGVSGSLSFGIGGGLIGYQLGGGVGAAAGSIMSLPIGYFVANRFFGNSRKIGPCPSYPKDVPCSLFAANNYNSSPGVWSYITSLGQKNYKCGGPNQGGSKCKADCCAAQSSFCDGEKSCMQARGC